jgi:hypothetical protein
LHVSCGSFLLRHELLAVSAQFKPLVLRVIILAGSHLRSYWLNFLRGLPWDLNKPITSIKIACNRKEPHCASRHRLAKHPLLPGDTPPFIVPVCFSRWWYSDVCRCLQRLRKQKWLSHFFGGKKKLAFQWDVCWVCKLIQI